MNTNTTTINDIAHLDTIELDELALVTEALEIKAQIAALEARDKAIRGQLADLCGIGTTKVGDHKVTVTIPQRWDAKGKEAAMSEYPIEKHPDLYEHVLNTKAVDAITDSSRFKTLGSVTTTIR